MAALERGVQPLWAHKRRSHRFEAGTETIVHAQVRGTSRKRRVAEAASPESIATAQPVPPMKCRQPADQKWRKKVFIAKAHPVCPNENPTTPSNPCLHGTGDQASFTISIATERASEPLLRHTQKLAPVLSSVGSSVAKSVLSDFHVVLKRTASGRQPTIRERRSGTAESHASACSDSLHSSRAPAVLRAPR